MDREQCFTTAVKIDGINPYVDVPPRVVEALDGGRKAAVLVKVARTAKKNAAATSNKGRLAKDAEKLKAIGRLAPGNWFRSTLVPMRATATRLYLDTWMRDVAGVRVGDRVRVTLKLDRGSRELLMPAELGEALEENAKAKAAWEALAPSRRREILTYLNFLKTKAALERNVQKTLGNLLAK